jgi:hypothetical protein
MKTTIKLLLFILVVLNGANLAFAVHYTFSRIYTGAALPGVAINDNGLVALISGESLITTDGVTTTKIAGWQTPNRLEFIGDMQVLSINNQGFVAFRGIGSNGKSGILASNGTTTRKIAAEKQDGGTFDFIPSGAMSINDSGMVAFEAWVSGSPTPFNLFLGDGTMLPGQVNARAGALPAMNNSGTIAYSGHLSELGYSTEIQKGAEVFSLMDPYIGQRFTPDINENGMVACVINNGASIVIGNGVSSPRYVDGSLYKGKIDSGLSFDGGVSTCAINNDEIVVFGARPQEFIAPSNHGPLGLFTGPNPVTDKLIMEGDPLESSTIKSLYFCRNGLNNNGQVAFIATLNNGISGVWVANPVPEPSILVLMAAGIVGLLVTVHRMV